MNYMINNPHVAMSFTDYSVINHASTRRERSKDSYFEEKKLVSSLAQISKKQDGPFFILKRFAFWEFLMAKGIVMTQTVVIKKSAFVKLGGFDVHLRYAEDTDLWIRAAHDFQCAVLTQPLFSYCIHSENMTHNREATYAGLLVVIRKHLHATKNTQLSFWSRYEIQRRVSSILRNLAIISSRREGVFSGWKYIRQIHYKFSLCFVRDVSKWILKSTLLRKMRV